MPAVNHVFTVFSLFAFTSASIPLTWHLTEASSWNAGTCLFIFWTGLSSLVWFVNSIVWDGNIVNWTPAWCDISTRVTIATAVGIPASMLVLQRRIYFIVRQSATANQTTAQKRRGLTIDLLIGLGLPILNMILSFIVQGHRFDIFEDVGCYPAIVNTSLTYLLVTLWPIFIGLASLVFTLMNLSYTQRHRHSLNSWMECTPSTLLTSSLYIRLVVLGLIAFAFSSMTSIRELVSQITGNSVTWPGWNVVHADFGRVDQIPRAIWAASGKYSGFGVELKRWVSVWCALAAFFVLGTTREAGERYKTFGGMMLRVIGGKGARRDQGSDGDLKSAEVIKSYYTHEEIVLPIIKKHQDRFPPPSPTLSNPSLPPSPSISRTPSVKVQQPTGTLTSSSPSPAPKSAIKVSEPRLSPYGPSYGTRAAITPEDLARKGGWIPPAPTSPGFGGDMLGALLTGSYKNKGERKKDGKKEKVMPKVMMTPF